MRIARTRKTSNIDGNILLARNRSRLEIDAAFVDTTGRHHNTAADHAVGRGRRWRRGGALGWPAVLLLLPLLFLRRNARAKTRVSLR